MPLVGQALPHDSARAHVTGEAIYLDDVVPFRDELLVDLVGSPVAHGRIKHLDLAAARQVDGIVAVLTHADVPGENLFGPVFHDEELLASGECHYLGQPIVVLAGKSRQILQQVKMQVGVEMVPLPAVLTIDEAIAQRRFIGPTRRIQCGNVAEAFARAEHLLEGTLISGGQEHFYLEPQSALAIPGEEGQLTVHSSTQNPTEVQALVARCLGVGQHQVVCVCRRMGGAFGGKETQAAQVAVLAALVAHRTGRPARLVLSCEQDMQLTGKRHPYQSHYHVSFTGDGHITGLKVDYYSNGGFSADLSLAVMERTLLHGENAYYIPNVEFTGAVCRTNLPSNTAFRGFGGPQAVAVMENIIEEIAMALGLDAYEVRRRNGYGLEERNLTPYGQVIKHNTLPAVMEQLAASSQYRERLAAIKDVGGKGPPGYLRGISLVPVKFGISFTRRTLNQASALVNLYLDGTVQVSTGGTEMGQGLTIKLAQLVADQFGLPLAAVRVMPTSTDKNNNTSPTAASASTDLNGSAAVHACEVLRTRLAEVAARKLASEDPSPAHVCFENAQVFDSRLPTAWLSFRELVGLAHEERINLGERGFFATPDIDFDWQTGKGTPFRYYTTGAAAAEVLIDAFTGDVKVTRVDLLLDLGRSINPAIDRGQVTGGFVQGMGWVTTECLRYSETGELLSHSPTTYKVPAVTDLPPTFKIAFLDADNPVNLYGSKAVGEPPLLLAVCVWTAVKHALGLAAGGRIPPLNLPATNEEVLRRLAVYQEPTQETDALAPAAQAPAPISPLELLHE
jgi:xanthine dehydrogenase large subunit